MQDCRISANSTAEQLGISYERVGSIIHEDLDMWKLSTKLVLKCLDADQKCQWYQSSEQLLEFFQRDANDFLSQLVTMDEIWLYHYDLETKQQSMEWQHNGSPCYKKFRVKKSTGKVLVSIFGIKTASPSFITFIRYEPSTHTITHLCNCATEGHFEGKTLREGHQGGLVLAR